MHAPAAFRPNAAPPPPAQWVGMGAAAVALGLALTQCTVVAAHWWFPGALALLWIGMAAGFGRFVRRLLFPRMSLEDPRRGPLALALGIAVTLALDNALGTWGVLALPGSLWAIWTMVVGNAMAIGGFRPLIGALDVRRMARAPLLWCALPALAALAAASAVQPGLLWSTEFGGYDALSYHLQLPKEWLEQGAIAPLPHNVYSAFPSFMEGAFLHLFALSGGATPAHSGAVAAQMLHALFAVAGAWMVGVLCASATVGVPGDRPADDRERRWARAIAWCMLLGVPWMLVTGSLAYNDLGVLVLLSGAMLAWVAAEATGGFRLGAAIGLLLGAAAGCKLTAVGMAVMPFAAWAIFWPKGPGVARALFAALPASAAAALLVLAPWLWRNSHMTGSPVFPFVVPWFSATSGPGRDGWWSAEQVARFAAAHGAEHASGLAARLGELWDAAFREGMGANPSPARANLPAEPWLPQWSVAWWVGGGALCALLVRAPRKAIALAAMLAAQCIFWMQATHMKPRFLLPCLVALGIATALAAAPWIAAATWRHARALAAALLVAWCAQPVAMLWMDERTAANLEQWARLGRDADAMGQGTAALAEGVIALGDPVPLAWAANYLLPPNAVLACEGEADVFWCRQTPRYGTVWDGGPLAAALRAHDNNIGGAVRALRDQGVTHLAIGEATLSRWRASGWLDPAVTPERVRSVGARLHPVATLISGGTLYRLP